MRPTFIFHKGFAKLPTNNWRYTLLIAVVIGIVSIPKSSQADTETQNALNTSTYPDKITTDNSELPSNQVNTVYIDSSNTVWIGTNAGLSRLSESGWKHYDTVLFNSNVNDIAYELTAYGKELWLATDSGLTVTAYTDIDGITGATTYTTENSDIIGNIVSAVDVDADHNRWIGTELALNIFKGSTWYASTTFIDVERDPFDFSDYQINDIQQYDTLALVATEGKGVARFSFNDVDGFSGASAFGKPWASIASNNVTAIAVDDTDQWYATTENGASLHDTPYTKSGWYGFSTENNLISNSVNSCFVDNKKNAWIGTNNGISIITEAGTVYSITTDDGLLHNHINHITGDISGNIWIASSGGLQWYSAAPPPPTNTIKTNAKEVSISAYPNPASKQVSVSARPKKAQEITISVYTISGKRISTPVYKQHVDTEGEEFSLDISDKSVYPSGMYFLMVEGELFHTVSRLSIH